MNRSDIKKTPGRLVFKSSSFLAKLNTAIEARLVSEMFAVGTDTFGELDQRQREAYFRILITPDGRLTSTLAAILWPYGNPTIGNGIFTDTDFPAVIHGSDASLDTFISAALEEMPPIKFSSIETAIGQATLLALRGNNMDWDDANSLLTQAASGGSTTDTGFAPSGIITQPYLATWGAITGFADFDTMDGFNVEFNVQFSDDVTDRQGLINRRLKSVSARVRCNPIGPTREQILSNMTLQGTGAGRGKTRQAAGADLTITGDDGVDYFVLKQAILTDQVQRWGSEQLRVGDVAWVCTRSFNVGVPGALFTMPFA